MNCIEVENINKKFGDTIALDRVSLIFEENKIYGLFGRNGAGKSTLLNIISNRIFSNNGQVMVDGAPAKENDSAQRKIYMMSEKNLYPEKMKIIDAFRWSKDFYPNFDIDYAKDLAEKFELNTKKAIRMLSTGYTSIFKIIIALSVNVPYVLFDEPVLGLDANHRELFYKLLIDKYSKNPFCAVISTHLIEEVSNVIEHIIIIKNGKIINNETCEDLLSKGYTVTGSTAIINAYIDSKNVIGTDSLGGLKTAYIIGIPDKETIPKGLEIAKLDLQKLFVQLTNS